MDFSYTMEISYGFLLQLFLHDEWTALFAYFSTKYMVLINVVGRTEVETAKFHTSQRTFVRMFKTLVL